ncbi:unnamed protein product [Calicophoron daubneyi]|uniref:Lebercilin domain-containing protein n=1 Tax=Calicophoron daubneyi TaxID=300641 RepID=A0AAV2THG7_CALDB
MLHANGDNVGEASHLIKDMNSAGDAREGNDTVLLQKNKALSQAHSDKRRRRQALQQVISARQQKIYEQQCEIEELRRRVREVCNDNKFLREQNYWQEKALEKLDGRQAELPQLINSHLEEVRVFREQIRRLKEVLKMEKQRRHDAEISKEKAVCELKHLRKLAEEQKLLEREDLMQAIEKLQTEANEREKLLINLERYAENLEKNQRFDCLRSAKTQREMRETCQKLLDRIHELEQTVQEKQKIIELGNIYSKRTIKHQSLGTQGDMQTAGTATENSVTETEQHKTIRERIREFDQRRQELEKRKERLRRRRIQQTTVDQVIDDEEALITFESADEVNQAVIDSDAYRPSSAHAYPGGSGAKSAPIGRMRPRTSSNSVILPKIRSRSKSGGRSAAVENKQVRFNEPSSVQTSEDEAAFEELRANEKIVRLFAEARLERDKEIFASLVKENKRNLSSDRISNSELLLHLKETTRDAKKSSDGESDLKKSGDTPKNDLPKPPQDDQSSSKSGMGLSIRSDLKKHEERGPVTLNASEVKPGGQITQEFSRSSDISSRTIHPIELSGSISTAELRISSPQIPQTTGELATYESFELVPVPEARTQICRPSGDQELDAYMTGDSASSSDGTTGGAGEDGVWQESPSFTAEHCGSNDEMNERTYPESNGYPSCSEGQRNERTFDSQSAEETLNAVPSGMLPLMRNNVPFLGCSARTTTLYTMINNSAKNQSTTTRGSPPSK